MRTLDVSVVVCTRNPRMDYFRRVVEALRVQSFPRTAGKLLLLIMASSPPVGERFAIDWHRNGRIVREEALGLTPARLRGIKEAFGSLLVFVDDDNVLAPNYLEHAYNRRRKAVYRLMERTMSWCVEEPPPEWTRQYWGNLVIREFNVDVWSNLPRLGQIRCLVGLAFAFGGRGAPLFGVARGGRPRHSARPSR